MKINLAAARQFAQKSGVTLTQTSAALNSAEASAPESPKPTLPAATAIVTPKSVVRLIDGKLVKVPVDDSPVETIPHESPDAANLIRQATHEGNAMIAGTDKLIESPAPLPEIIPANSPVAQSLEMDSLIDEDFPFDESQLAAIEGISGQKYACLTGSAGTGKTTVTKAIVERIRSGLDAINMAEYWKKGYQAEDDEEYEIPQNLVPAVAMCAFTGKASQQIKRNFPRSWHGNIMTIHRMLGYFPEWYDDFDAKTNEMVKKVRFIPAYTAENKLPWKVIVIDEAGMLSVDLWHTLWAAVPDDCVVIMIGDINQLPPTHGKSIFGFGMVNWPTWELTTIHRQEGANNSIVDNAWRIINGKSPVSDDTSKPDWKFVMMELSHEPSKAAKQVRAFLKTNRDRGIYDEMRDVVITPINAYEPGVSGYHLGQAPLNDDLTLMFHDNERRYLIDAGRDRRRFAVGDRVMVTKNDHEAELTNGMMGEIIEIAENGAWSGDRRRYGRLPDLQQYMEEDLSDGEDENITFDLSALSASIEDAVKKGDKDSSPRGPSSHIVTVRFNAGTAAQKDVFFSTLSEISSLVIAYAVTCHKMQGGEAPLIIVIAHGAHKSMLYREWLYTAVTRAQEKCILLYTGLGLTSCLNKQSIKGSTLKAKVESFNKLQEKGLLGSAVRIQLPKAEAL